MKKKALISNSTLFLLEELIIKKKLIIASSTFIIVFISFFTFLSISIYQAHQRKVEIARVEEIRKQREETRKRQIEKEAREEAKLIANNRIKYLEKCKKIARAGGIEIHPYGGRSFIAGHPKSEYQCAAYVEKQLNREAEVRAIADKYTERKLRQYRQTTPSGIDYSHRERAYEHRTNLFYQNFSSDKRPK